MRLLRDAAFSVLFATLGVASAGAQAPATLSVIAETGTAKNFTLADLLALPQIEVPTKEANGSNATFRGPTLRDVMTQVGAPAGHVLRGPAMTLAILAEAADKYQVGYTLAEIDEQFGAKTVIIALRQDGKDLPPRDGPFRIVVAGEEHRARWIRQLTSLRLVRLGRAP